MGDAPMFELFKDGEPMGQVMRYYIQTWSDKLQETLICITNGH